MLFVLIILTIMNLVECLAFERATTVFTKDLFCYAIWKRKVSAKFQLRKSPFFTHMPIIKPSSLLYLLFKNLKFLFIRWDAVVVGQGNLTDVKATEDVVRVAVIA
jgi:hypothetical protein